MFPSDPIPAEPGAPPVPPPRKTTWLVCALLFLYLVAVRTHTISEQFWLLGEQIRDWRIALGPFWDLPLVGTPSTAGGTTFGPVYYWVLWIIRVTIGPFYDNLPHAGGIGLSIVQAAADAVLLYALVRRLRSLPLALAIVLLAASSPYDMALTATIWNPPLAVALCKLAIAVVLLQREWSLARTCAVTVLAWFAVQAHMGSLFVAIPAIGWMLVQPFAAWQPKRGLQAARAVVEIVLLLQIPYAIDHWYHVQPAAQGAIGRSLAYTLQHPAELRPVESARSLGGVMSYLLFAPWPPPLMTLILAVAVAALVWFWRRDRAIVATSAAPLVLAVAGYAAWQGRMGEHYWYLPLLASASMTLFLAAFAAVPERRRLWAAGALLVAVVAVQPVRCRAAWQIHRVPEYGAVVRGARQIARRTPRIRAVVAPFLPATSDAGFIYEVLGGRISPESLLVAHIDTAGNVRYEHIGE